MNTRLPDADKRGLLSSNPWVLPDCFNYALYSRYKLSRSESTIGNPRPLSKSSDEMSVLGLSDGGATVLGFEFSERVLPLAGEQAVSMIQAVIIGTIIHSLIHREHVHRT